MAITTGQRIYLWAVAFLGLWVGVFSYFNPALADWGLPWLVPPLCATFLGSFYLSGGLGLIVCVFSRSWTDIRAVLPMIAIWTGGLTVVSLFYWSAFDFDKTQVWVWFGAYISYPLIALGLLWRWRGLARIHPQGEPTPPRWLRAYLLVQGTVLTAVSVALLFAAQPMQSLWPWKTSLMMLQFYSQPLLAYGVGSVILSRQSTWSEIRAGTLAIGFFMGAELIASIRFLALFNGAPLSIAIWLGCLLIASAMLLLVSALSIRMREDGEPSVPRYYVESVAG